MKTLKFISLLCATLVLCNSCLKGLGWEEEQLENQAPEDKPLMGLVLTATPSTIIANGEDTAVLKLTYDGIEVTEGFTLYDGKTNNIVELENMEFRTDKAGEYTFWAEYKSELTNNKTKTTEELLTIIAKEPVEENPNVPQGPEDDDPTNLNFKRRVLLVQFTGTGCGYCPGMTSTLRTVMSDEEYADKAILTAAHRYNQTDPAYLSGYALDQAMGISGYPALSVDMRTRTSYYQYPDYIKAMIDDSMERSEAKAGIAATSVVEDGQIIINASVKAAEDTELRIGVWVLEDGIYGQQSNYGVAEGDFNIHDHCIRVADSKVNGYDYSGYAIGPVDEEGNVQAMKRGETAERVFTIDIKNKWKLENCSLVIFVSTPERNGGVKYFYVNNVIKMPLEGETTFEYEEETSDEDSDENTSDEE
ncbi:MAG: Omp28-related outer membrane protein [Alistipes sp.]|nr:Omp28-related outer membrane protein [Alistipes sp.]